MSEFFGRLAQEPENKTVKWVVRDDTKVNHNVRDIEDGDFLEVYDDMGRTVFSKHIIEDYDSHYNMRYKKQIFKGTPVKWLPYGVDAGFWSNMFGNRFRARVVKQEQDDE